ncbi:MAG: EVE domain-containing protein [Candidatus Manganitrophaceae bacterium]
MAPERQYWLMKSEPNVYSIDHLKKDGTTYWSGVRNYQARNFMRDQMRVGDGVLFYHSNTEPVGIAGRAEVIKTGYPDRTAWDPKDRHYDPKSLPSDPIWFMVDIRFVKACREVISLEKLREIPALKGMMVLRKGNRLSITPVTPEEWETILEFPQWF